MTERKIVFLGVALAALLIFIYWLAVVVYGRQGFFVVFAHGLDWPMQLILGSGLGAVAGGVSLLALNRVPFLADLRHLFITIIKEGSLGYPSMVLISAMAGISEELLFRGCIQGLIGIWWTSFIFVALHGYFNPFRLGVNIYGLLMLLVSIGLGLLYVHLGLWAAITAHMCVDIVILWGLAMTSHHSI